MRVLQGYIAIDTAIFPTGTTGYTIYVHGCLLRPVTLTMLQRFMDLNVYEGPQGIGVRIAYNNTALKPGMTMSNGLGYYADGKWGVCIESAVVVREVETANNFGKIGYLGFERFTMCPIQTSLIDLSLLTVEEKKWLNEYHAEVEAKVGPLLEGKDARALAWLKKQCQAI